MMLSTIFTMLYLHTNDLRYKLAMNTSFEATYSGSHIQEYVSIIEETLRSNHPTLTRVGGMLYIYHNRGSVSFRNDVWSAQYNKNVVNVSYTWKL